MWHPWVQWYQAFSQRGVWVSFRHPIADLDTLISIFCVYNAMGWQRIGHAIHPKCFWTPNSKILAKAVNGTWGYHMVHQIQKKKNTIIKLVRGETRIRNKELGKKNNEEKMFEVDVDLARLPSRCLGRELSRPWWWMTVSHNATYPKNILGKRSKDLSANLTAEGRSKKPALMSLKCLKSLLFLPLL